MESEELLILGALEVNDPPTDRRAFGYDNEEDESDELDSSEYTTDSDDVSESDLQFDFTAHPNNNNNTDTNGACGSGEPSGQEIIIICYQRRS